MYQRIYRSLSCAISTCIWPFIQTRPRTAFLMFVDLICRTERQIILYDVMAESQKVASSPTNSKEKDLLLADVDFGKDFLSSWKTMSGADSDATDFDFGLIAKGKKKAFNFDTLDVDFTLDGDLDKISSFKVDMSDLDIHSPPKRAGKAKERTKGSDGGNHQMNEDRFSFPFDFNEFGNFSFESRLMKEGNQSNKNQNSEETSSRSKCQGFGTDLIHGASASEAGITPKLPVSVSATTSKIETPVCGFGDLDPVRKNSLSSSERNDSAPLQPATVEHEVALEETRIFPAMTTISVTQEKNQENHQQENRMSPEPYDEQTMQDLPVQSVYENESSQHNASEAQIESFSQATELHGNAVAGTGLSENLEVVKSPAQCSARSLRNDNDRDTFGSDSNVPVGYAQGAEPAQVDSYSEDTPPISVSVEATHDTSASGDAQNANGKLRLATLRSGTSIGKSTHTKEKQTGNTQSSYFKRSDEAESPSQQAPSIQEKPTMFGDKRTCSGKPCFVDEGREGVDARDSHSGSKLVGISRPDSGEIDKGKVVQPGSRKSVKGLEGLGERYNASGALNGTKLFVSSRTCVRGIMKVEPVQGSEKNKENLITLSSCLSPSSSLEQTNKSITQGCLNPRLPASRIALSAKSSNDVGDEGRQFSSPKAGKSILDISSLKISRAVGAKHQPSKSALEKETIPLRNTLRNVEKQQNKLSKIALLTKKQISPTPHLKRKAFEGLNADMLTLLNPSKRFSPSATETRNGECSERVVKKEVCSNKNPTEDIPYNDLNNLQTSTPDTLREVDMTDLEIPLVLENDDNVDRADAYTKELENICNMLKKKHEEAKELLVRAIVNNNKLLMLDHPIYEEKIREVQKFAAELMSK